MSAVKCGVLAAVMVMSACEKAPSPAPATQAGKAVPQSAATNEPAPAKAPAATPAPTVAPPAKPADAAPAPANPLSSPAAPGTSPADLPPTLGTGTVENGVMTVAGITMKVPEGWESVDVGTATIRPAVKFTIPAPAGTSIEAGTISAFSGIKGTPEQNLARWLAQVNNLEGRPEKEQFEQNGLTLTRLVAVGTYNPGFGMTGGQAKENWVMYGLVISGGPEGDVQILGKGPKEVMLRQREAWDAFMKSAAPVTPIEKPAETPGADEPKAAG